jgi:ribosomal protein S18 acetylase RimI-like enzyme
MWSFMTTPSPTIDLRPALAADASALADLVLMSGENLLTCAFGGNRRDAVMSLEALCRTWGTMFTYERATVAIDHEREAEGPLGVIISHPSDSERQTGQRLAEVLIGKRGWWQWLRMLPVALALERCSEPIPPDVTYVSILAVVPEHRSEGIGTKLLRHAEARARLSGDQTICLDVEIDNARAIAFYERNGFHTVTERPSSAWLRSKGIAGLRRLAKAL